MEPLKIIKRITENLNYIKSQKCGYPPEEIKQNTIDNKNFQEIYDFYRLFKVKSHSERYKRADILMDKKNRKQLRNPLLEEEKVLVLEERLKKKDPPKQLYKATTKNIPYFNRDQVFTIKKVVKNSDHQYNCWVAKEGEKNIQNKRYLRQELFALKSQFANKIQPILIHFNKLKFHRDKKFLLEISNDDEITEVLLKLFYYKYGLFH